MPYYATNTLTPEDKRRILSVLPTASTHLFAMARGQIYHAPFNAANSSEWKPLDLRGAIIFGRDSRKEAEDDSSFSQQSDDSSGGTHDDDLWFRLVELDGKSPRVVWRQPVSVISSDYKMLVPFFHVFSGNSRMFGFRFDEDEEASRFYETVMIRTKERPLIKPNPLSRSWSKNVQRRRSTLPARSLKIPASTITNPDPDSFRHCAHLGLDDRGNIIVEGEVDKKWSVLFNEAPWKNKGPRIPSFAGAKKFKDYILHPGS